MMKRILPIFAVAIVSVVATAGIALADYPPTGTVKGKTVETVAPDGTLAFTGSNTVSWIALALVLLVLGAALLRWASLPHRPTASS